MRQSARRKADQPREFGAADRARRHQVRQQPQCIIDGGMPPRGGVVGRGGRQVRDQLVDHRGQGSSPGEGQDWGDGPPGAHSAGVCGVPRRGFRLQEHHRALLGADLDRCGASAGTTTFVPRCRSPCSSSTVKAVVAVTI